jgi:tetratricopeptide (TPR) repeat protein
MYSLLLNHRRSHLVFEVLVLVMASRAVQSSYAQQNSHASEGSSWLNLKQYDKAIEECSIAIGQDANNARVFNTRGLAWKAKGEFKKALSDFNESTRLGRTDAAFSNRSGVWVHLGKFQTAIADADTAIQLNPKLADAYHNRAAALFQLDDFVRAMNDCDQALSIDPGLTVTYIVRGQIRYRLQLYQKAIDDFTEALRRDPTNAVVYVLRGNVHDTNQQFDMALADYEKALRIDPKCAEALMERATAFTNQEKYQAAVDDLQRLVALNPDYPDALNSLSWVLSTSPLDDVRNGRVAVELAQKAGSIEKWASSNSYDTLAAALAENGEFEEAVVKQNEAIARLREEGELLTSAQYRLTLYLQHQPVREYPITKNKSRLRVPTYRTASVSEGE